MTRPLPDAEDVNAFWFDELTDEQWWKPDSALDETIRERFLPLHDAVAERVPSEWLETAEGLLAAVIVLDQFPRNMFRGLPRAFATDASALAVARDAVEKGLHQKLDNRKRGILFMPFQHAEDREAQARSVALFATLGAPEQLIFAEQHKEIIDRFGRFPHRNDCLGRASTEEEIAFLEGPALFW